MTHKARIVLGLGYGDEGKGLVTDYLCRCSTKPIVVRFNGGQQAGHTVVSTDEHRRVFSNFGSGTLRMVPTYWSSYCTFAPAYFLEEYKSLDVSPTVYLDKFSPITTHYDVLYNRATEISRGSLRHGSCGLGFGATIQRNRISSLQFCAGDLLSPPKIIRKLDAIRRYYKYKIDTETRFNFNHFDHDSEDRQFILYAEEINNLQLQGVVTLVTETDIFSNNIWETYVFEGAQGILLDVDYGNSPFVTKSNTTSKNAHQMLSRNVENCRLETEVFYVTRAYQTRHGAGPFTHYQPPLVLTNNDGETNKYNDYQGEFKVTYLNIEQLNYSLHCDAQFSAESKKHLVVTCLDQLSTDYIPVCINNKIRRIQRNQLPELLNCNFSSTIFSNSACSDNLFNI